MAKEPPLIKQVAKVFLLGRFKYHSDSGLTILFFQDSHYDLTRMAKRVEMARQGALVWATRCPDGSAGCPPKRIQPNPDG